MEKDRAERVLQLTYGAFRILTPDQRAAVESAVKDMLPNRELPRKLGDALSFELERRSIHATKAEFDEALALARRSLTLLRDLDELLREGSATLGLADDYAFRSVDHKQETSNALRQEDMDAPFVKEKFLIYAAKELGFTRSLRLLIGKKMISTQIYIEVLEVQGDIYWRGSHRPADWHARNVAEWLCRLYVEAYGKRPTMGSGAGGKPAGKFARALDTILRVLGIETGFATPGKWAISEVTDEQVERAKDALNPPLNALLALGLGGLSIPPRVSDGSAE